MILLLLTLSVNAALCALQYIAQQRDVTAGRIAVRRSLIAGTTQRFNHWQDAACQTWGDMLGLGLGASTFVTCAWHGLATWQWGMFFVLSALGSVLWYLFVTDSEYKPNWQITQRGAISNGGWLHIGYFGLQLGIFLTTLQLLLQGAVPMVAMLTTLIGWGMYLVAIVVDVRHGHKARRTGVTSHRLLWKFVKTGRIRGTVYTAVCTDASFRMVLYIQDRPPLLVWLIAAIALALLHMCIMSFNDWFDREHDVAKEKTLATDHPILFWRYVVGLCSVTVLLIVVLALADVRLAVFCAAVLVLGIVYSYVGKVLVLNTFIVATCAASPVLAGAVYTGTFELASSWYAVFFLMHLAREIFKDMDDLHFDQLESFKQTIPVRFGNGPAQHVATTLCAAAGVILFVVKEAKKLSLLVMCFVYWLLRLDSTSNPRRQILLLDVALALLVINMGWFS